ncbi:MAG: coproporphyrinogen III oxidase, partial [Rhodospirillales bacterium]
MNDTSGYGGDAHKARASEWFEELRDELTATLEAIEDTAIGPTPTSGRDPGRFARDAWDRGGDGDGN